MKKLVSLFLAFVMAVGLVGCGSSSDNGNSSVGGVVKLDGSTSMEKLVGALSEAMPEAYPNISLEAQFTGSSSGIKALIAGTADIGDASRNLKDDEIASGAVENIVAIDGIAVAVNPNLRVGDITSEQLAQIYTGEITNWSQLGGQNEAIVVIGRDSASGTRGAFEEILDIEGACKYAQEIESTGAVVAKVASIEGAIGYVSLDMIDDTVKAMSLNGVAPSNETIADGSYTLARPFVMATMGEISQQSEAVKAVFDFIASEDGQKVLEAVGLVGVN
ncbi:MAG: phosphate ABC transporter substrate-binding protein [Erysipelotrichaceae bacterium]|nr:phosphate ABC transporter substrate-binding protein [Erysipelotrichaceae bacterium]MDD3809133.1 phosphate ABC transporter substrate-binding protein [Erysipelotrichaceae bacterium]